MERNRFTTLMLITCLGAALFAWSHAQFKARQTVASAIPQLARDDDTSLTLAGTIVPAITTPIIRRNWNLAVPLNIWVKRGDVIGIEETQTAPAEMDSARQELKDAGIAERRASDGLRQAEEELGASRAGNMGSRQAQVSTAGFDYNAAVTGREPVASIGTDEWEAKAQEAQAELPEARTRRKAAPTR